MGYFYVILMVLFVILMASMRKLRNKNVANKISMTCFVFILLFALLAFFSFSDDGSSTMIENSKKFYVSQGNVLGQLIRKTMGKGKNILVVSLPEEYKKKHIVRMIDELDDDADANKVVYTKLDVAPGKDGSPSITQVNTIVLDEVDFSNSDVVIFTFTPPLGAYERSKIAARAGSKKLAVFIIGLNDASAGDRWIRSGILSGATRVKDTTTAQDTPKRTPEETFKTRYILMP